MFRTITTTVTALAALILIACGGPTQEQKDAAVKERAKATKMEKKSEQAALLAASCRQQVGGLVRTLRDTSSRLDVGMSFADYSDQVGEISIAYNRIPFGRMDIECTMGAGISAEKAFNSYNKAYNAWNDCISDLYCDMDSVDPDLQKNWSKAGSQVARSRSALSDLEDLAITAQSDAEAQSKKAEKAEAVLE